jgi:hypothetical protein
MDHSTARGLFSGLEFYDGNGNSILKAGRIDERMPWFQYMETRIDENERLVGIRSGKRNEVIAHHYDL